MTTTEPTTDVLRARYVQLLAASQYNPDSVTSTGKLILSAHEKVAYELFCDDGEDVYGTNVVGAMARARLREIVPGWFES